ncbi:acyltransferase [Gluconobacter potus]|uniref:acyltransferase n=1 Tax=Gluconobacter potus TaxID=2724927 RepID=UPI0039E879E8
MSEYNEIPNASVTPLSFDSNILDLPLGETAPMAQYAHVLSKLRSKSREIRTPRDEIAFGREFATELAQLATHLGLPKNHFSVDISGQPLEVSERTGRHLISPTHFENGSYFSHPHADHQLRLPAIDIPKIKIGRYVRFGKGAGVNAGADVSIGDGAWLSPGSLLLRQDHDAYGRPSIGARTVGMTTLPAITLEQFAWIGRDAMVGWNSDYIGRCSVVATRAFVNTWVGDYSIVGDRGRILQYQPFKAHFLETFKPTLERLLEIGQWEEIDADWRGTFARESKILQRSDISVEIQDFLGGPLSFKHILVINPTHSEYVKIFSGSKLDVISDSRSIFPYLLQTAVDQHMNGLRVRSQNSTFKLPFVSGARAHYRRTLGYQLVIVDSFNAGQKIPEFSEIKRITKPDGYILIPLCLLPDAEQVVKEGKIGGKNYALIKKT